MRVAFDCDGTLIGYDNKLRDDMVRLLLAFIVAGAEVTVWSGGGRDYARGVWGRVVREYNLRERLDSSLWEGVVCIMKDKAHNPDLTFDDMPVSLGVLNVCIPPKVSEDT